MLSISKKKILTALLIVSLIMILSFNTFFTGFVFSERLAQDVDNDTKRSEDILKPGEATDFIPTPVPLVPLPSDAIIGTPGAPRDFPDTEKDIPTPQVTTRPAEEPWHQLVHYDLTPIESKQIAFMSDEIILAQVMDLQSYWSTRDRQRPVNPNAAENHDYIYTDITVKVEKVLDGKTSVGDLLHLMENGGQVGEDQLVIEDVYDAFTPGQKVLLYLSLRANPDTNEQFYIINERYWINQATQTVTNPFFQKPLSIILTEIDEVNQMKQEIKEGRFTPPPPPSQ